MKTYSPSQFVAVYHPFVRTLHWLMALLIFAALGLGVWATQLPRGDLRGEVLFVHKSLGVAVLALIVVRILARLALGTPPYAAPLDRLTDAAAGGRPSRALRADDRAAGQRLCDVERRRARGVVLRPLHAAEPRRRRTRPLAEAADEAHYAPRLGDRRGDRPCTWPRSSGTLWFKRDDGAHPDVAALPAGRARAEPGGRRASRAPGAARRRRSNAAPGSPARPAAVL